MNALIKVIVFACATLGSSLSHAVAPVVTLTYTDEALFRSLLDHGSMTGFFPAPLPLGEPYESVTSVETVGVTFTSNGVTNFQGDQRPNSFYLIAGAPNKISTQDGVNPDPISPYTTLNIMTATLSPTGATALGFSYGSSASGSLGLTIGLSNGFQTQSSFSAPGFIGFISSTAITSVTFTHSATAPATFDLTQVIVGAAPVPEPSTTIMFGVGLVFLGAIGRRKMRKQ